MSRVIRFLDRLEDRTREHLSRIPIVYAIIGAISVVLFWRGVWDTADVFYRMGGIWEIVFNPFISLLISTIVLLGTGLFVSFFIGDRIIMSGLKREKKIEEKTEAEVQSEETKIVQLNRKIDSIAKALDELSRKLDK